jgi:DNA primase
MMWQLSEHKDLADIIHAMGIQPFVIMCGSRNLQVGATLRPLWPGTKTMRLGHSLAYKYALPDDLPDNSLLMGWSR